MTCSPSEKPIKILRSFDLTSDRKHRERPKVLSAVPVKTKSMKQKADGLFGMVTTRGWPARMYLAAELSQQSFLGRLRTSFQYLFNRRCLADAFSIVSHSSAPRSAISNGSAPNLSISAGAATRAHDPNPFSGAKTPGSMTSAPRSTNLRSRSGCPASCRAGSLLLVFACFCTEYSTMYI